MSYLYFVAFNKFTDEFVSCLHRKTNCG